MTPAARIAAAIEILDQYLEGSPAEKALTNWARRSRFAGSGDRAAIRDHVFSALRNLRSFGALGGAHSGRGLMIGMLRARGQDPAVLFTGEGHAPAPLDAAEAGRPSDPLPECVALDCPDWLEPALRSSLGDNFAGVLDALRSRAPVFLRVNAKKAQREQAQTALACEGIVTRPHRLSDCALEVIENERKISKSELYMSGAVELQDAGSQHVADALPLTEGARVLDYCAGGGGKTLALAARGAARCYAHDANFARMADLPARAKRAGANVQLLDGAGVSRFAPYDLVLCDVPCSGSGAWRRSPEAKWAFSPEKLESLLQLQAEILDNASVLVAPGGSLAYVTCSLLKAENQERIDDFQRRNLGWTLENSFSVTPLDGGDGFFFALLTRVQIKS